MFEIVNNFLLPGLYAREKGQFARKVSWQPLNQFSSDLHPGSECYCCVNDLWVPCAVLLLTGRYSSCSHSPRVPRNQDRTG